MKPEDTSAHHMHFVLSRHDTVTQTLKSKTQSQPQSNLGHCPSVGHIELAVNLESPLWLLLSGRFEGGGLRETHSLLRTERRLGRTWTEKVDRS